MKTSQELVKLWHVLSFWQLLQLLSFWRFHSNMVCLCVWKDIFKSHLLNCIHTNWIIFFSFLLFIDYFIFYWMRWCWKGSAIQCWICNSNSDLACGDTFRADIIISQSLQKECPYAASGKKACIKAKVEYFRNISC